MPGAALLPISSGNLIFLCKKEIFNGICYRRGAEPDDADKNDMAVAAYTEDNLACGQKLLILNSDLLMELLESS